MRLFYACSSQENLAYLVLSLTDGVSKSACLLLSEEALMSSGGSKPKMDKSAVLSRQITISRHMSA